MIIDLKTIRNQGKTEENFFFEYAAEDGLISLPNVGFAEPVRIDGKVSVVNKNAVYVTADIKFALSGECSRCLKDTVNLYQTELNAEFSTDKNCDYTYQNDKLDLTKAVNDELILAMPYTFLCDENCLGICPGCGKNLNTEKCECQK